MKNYLYGLYYNLLFSVLTTEAYQNLITEFLCDGK